MQIIMLYKENETSVLSKPNKRDSLIYVLVKNTEPQTSMIAVYENIFKNNTKDILRFRKNTIMGRILHQTGNYDLFLCGEMYKYENTNSS